ncbi:MAG: hypothetical protein EP343_06590 [Deltaproteobacteria bacterium]|nr:MAG: hypothetical protein EP343_06590 [Deltaproteobacteria bacterium]
MKRWLRLAQRLRDLHNGLTHEWVERNMALLEARTLVDDDDGLGTVEAGGSLIDNALENLEELCVSSLYIDGPLVSA